MVTDILHDMLQGQPCLWGSGDDLISWQDKTVAASVPQLEGKGVFDSRIVGPVNATPAGLIWARKNIKDVLLARLQELLLIQLVITIAISLLVLIWVVY